MPPSALGAAQPEPQTPGILPGALARKIAAHAPRRPDPPDHAPHLSRAWDRALRLAAGPWPALGLRVTAARAVRAASLQDALDPLPQTGLLAGLEGPGEGRGLIALSHGALDALIEVQATGRVDPRGIAPRTVTRIDEMLARDFLDLALAGFAREAALPGADWPARLSYGGVLAMRDRLPLLLAEGAYHLLTAEIAFADAPERVAQACLVMPVTVAAAPAAGAGEAARLSAWRAALRRNLSGAPLPLSAVLLRATRPVSALAALCPGDVIAFDPRDLAEVTLEDAAGLSLLRGALGQSGGRRALRVQADPPEDGAEAPPETPDAPDAAPEGPPPPAEITPPA